MMTTYILILVLSAALMAFGMGLARARLSQVLGRPMAVPQGAIALSVAAAMLIVVAAPWWLFLALVGLALALPRVSLSPMIVILIATLPLVAAPFVGATAGLALDAALIAAALMGETYAA